MPPQQQQGYGAPPQQQQQQGYGAPPQPQAGIGLAPGEGMGFKGSDFSSGALIAAVTTDRGFHNARLMGAAFLGLGFLFWAINFILAFAVHIYFPWFAVLGGPFGLGGFFMVVTGQPQGRPDGSGGAPMWGRAGLGACLGVGLLFGILFAVALKIG